ncbi:hypothetical protein JTB14_008683 [Gonioctena quinquepunctata]|nr:hypothetical protein JTB14_008683 [Gonioctena quinquepunctata]
MKPDKISEIVKNDLLICLFGETHLKKHRRPQIANVTSNKMRELARLLIALRDMIGLRKNESDASRNDIVPVKTLIEVMKPEFFDNLVAAAKVIAGFNPDTKTFKASSLALHMGTSLKQLCTIIHRHILKKSKLFDFKDIDFELRNIKHLQKLIEDHWATEISSLALKDMTEKHWEKPQIIPITNDIIKFNNYVKKEVEESYDILFEIIENDGRYIEYDKQTLIFNYKRLSKGIMALVLILNRKRIGEVQYLKTLTYLKDFSDSNNQEELLQSLSTSEKLLCKNFKRVVSGGKGSRPVPILFSPFMQQKIDLLLKVRKIIKEIPESNEYLFSNPHSAKGWFHGVSVIRSFASACGAHNSASLTSTKFRKQTATILQIMNINENDMEQLASFMGHTKKTHEEWYRLPQDVYQTAKIAKILMLIDQGKAHNYKGKGLEDINIDETDVLEIEETNLSIPTKGLEKNNFERHINACFEEETENFENNQSRKRMKLTADSDSDQNEKENEVQNNQMKLKSTGCRKRWKKEEKDIMLRYFKHFIKDRKAPKKCEVEEFKLKEKEVFSNIDWLRIKTFIYNQYRDN